MTRVSVGDKLPPLAVDVTATTVILGAMASRDWRPMHHDKDFAVERNGMRDIFMNAPAQAGWFERYLSDWAGPEGRLGRAKFRIRKSLFPGDRMTLEGEVESVETDERGCLWAGVALSMRVDDEVVTECRARLALPAGPGDNPWARSGDDWQP